MKELTKISRMIIAIIVFIFITQILFERSSNFPLNIIESIHNTRLKDALVYISKIFSYLIISIFLVYFFMITFVVDPNIVDNTLNIIYICTSLFLAAYSKLLLAELRPFMYAYLTKSNKIWIFDCESDFGAPSNHIFYSVITYYLYKTRFFEKRYHVVLSEKRQDSSSNEFRKNFFDLKKNDFVYKKDGWKIFNFFFPLKLMNIIFFSFIGGLIFFRYIAGSHFFTQSFFSLILVFFWSHVFFVYLRLDIRRYIADIVTNPNTRLRSTKYFNFLIYLLIFHTFIMAICRSYFQNQAETDQLYHLISKKCDHFYTIENQSLKDSLILLFPIFLLNFYNFLNIGWTLKDKTKKNQRFRDLDTKKKGLRYLFFLSIAGLIFLLKISIDYIVIKNTVGNFFNGYNIFIYGIYMILLALFIGILYPYLMIKQEALLKYEFLYEEDFEIMKTGKEPKKKTRVFIVADNEEEGENEAAIVKGKRIFGLNRVN